MKRKVLSTIFSGLIIVAIILALSIAGLVRLDKVSDPRVEMEELEEIVVTATRSYAPPFWNLWVENSSTQSDPTFEPIQRLRTNAAYELIVDLSMLSYDLTAVKSSPAGIKVRDTIAAAQADITFDLLLLANNEEIYFDSGRRYGKAQLHAETSKYHDYVDRADEEIDWDEGEVELEDTEIFELAGGERLGVATIPFNTRRASGAIWMSLSIWSNGLPIDEVPIQVCIESAVPEDSCDDESFDYAQAPGVLGVAASMSPETSPAASFQFVDAFDTGVVGVFRCNKCGWDDRDFLTWDIGKGADALSEYLTETIQRSFEAAAGKGDKDFEAAGRALFRTLVDSRNPVEAKNLRRRISEALRSISATTDEGTPTIFVRVINAVGDAALNVPLNLMRVDFGEDEYFVGSKFRVHSPLLSQSYGDVGPCIDQWVSLVPPPKGKDIDPHLENARASMSATVNALKGWSGHSLLYEEIDPFRNWLEGRDKENEAEEELTEAAVMIFSHHESNSLYFNSRTRNPSITSSAIDRLFGSRSLAIINACGVASPGASEFLMELNNYGVPSVVTTSMSVNAEMAGKFVVLLVDELDKRKDEPQHTIGDAVFAVTKKLAVEEGYGAQAYIYSVYGNSSLRVCGPPLK